MADEEPSALLPKIMKTLGVITAVISLVLGGRQIVNMISESGAKKEKAKNLNNEAQQLASSGNYSRAWQSISQAVELRPEYRDQQAEIAMAWLREIRISSTGGEKSFSEIVDKVVPALYGAIDTTRKKYSAKILAHIGWANYLKFKEGDRAVKVEEQYIRALNLDSTNVYAHVMFGHWILFPAHGEVSIDEANRHFALALKSGREKKYVRGLMFAAYRNNGSVEYQAQMIKLVNDIRKNGEAMDAAERKKILEESYFMYRGEIVKSVGKVLSPKDHHDTFVYLTEGMDISSRAYLEDAWRQLKDVGVN